MNDQAHQQACAAELRAILPQAVHDVMVNCCTQGVDPRDLGLAFMDFIAQSGGDCDDSEASTCESESDEDECEHEHFMSPGPPPPGCAHFLAPTHVQIPFPPGASVPMTVTGHRYTFTSRPALPEDMFGPEPEKKNRAGIPVNSGYAKSRQVLREKRKRVTMKAEEKAKAASVIKQDTPPHPQQPPILKLQKPSSNSNPSSSLQKKVPEKVTTNTNPLPTDDLDELVRIIEGTHVSPSKGGDDTADAKKLAKKIRKKEKKRLEEEAQRKAEEELALRIEEERLRAEEELRQEKARKKREKKKRRKNKKKDGKVEEDDEDEEEEKAPMFPIPGPKSKCSSEMVTIRRHSSNPDSTTVTISMKSQTGDEDQLLYTLVNGQVVASKRGSLDAPVPTGKNNMVTIRRTDAGPVVTPAQSAPPKTSATASTTKKSKGKATNASSSSKANSGKENGYHGAHAHPSGGDCCGAGHAPYLSSIPQNGSSYHRHHSTSTVEGDEEIDFTKLKLPPGITITKVKSGSANSGQDTDTDSSEEEDNLEPPPMPGGGLYNSEANMIVMNGSWNDYEEEEYDSDEYFFTGRRRDQEFSEVVPKRKRTKAKSEDPDEKSATHEKVGGGFTNGGHAPARGGRGKRGAGNARVKAETSGSGKSDKKSNVSRTSRRETSSVSKIEAPNQDKRNQNRRGSQPQSSKGGKSGRLPPRFAKLQGGVALDEVTGRSSATPPMQSHTSSPAPDSQQRPHITITPIGPGQAAVTTEKPAEADLIRMEALPGFSATRRVDTCGLTHEIRSQLPQKVCPPAEPVRVKEELPAKDGGSAWTHEEGDSDGGTAYNLWGDLSASKTRQTTPGIGTLGNVSHPFTSIDAPGSSGKQQCGTSWPYRFNSPSVSPQVTQNVANRPNPPYSASPVDYRSSTSPQFFQGNQRPPSDPSLQQFANQNPPLLGSSSHVVTQPRQSPSVPLPPNSLSFSSSNSHFVGHRQSPVPSNTPSPPYNSQQQKLQQYAPDYDPFSRTNQLNPNNGNYFGSSASAQGGSFGGPSPAAGGYSSFYGRTGNYPSANFGLPPSGVGTHYPLITGSGKGGGDGYYALNSNSSGKGSEYDMYGPMGASNFSPIARSDLNLTSAPRQSFLDSYLASKERPVQTAGGGYFRTHGRFCEAQEVHGVNNLNASSRNQQQQHMSGQIPQPFPGQGFHDSRGFFAPDPSLLSRNGKPGSEPPPSNSLPNYSLF